MNKTTKSSRLQGKDLMNIGIYSAIYCVIVTGVAMLGYIPIMMPMLCALVPLIAGVPFMLFLTKVKKFGMIWIMSIIIGIFMILTGMAHYALIVGFFTGLIAELIYKSGNYAEAYWATRQSFGEEYITTLNSLMPMWLCPVLLIASFVFGIIGGMFGKALLKKHFKKAGIV